MDNGNNVKKEQMKGFITGVLFGGAIGTVAALLTAPQSGKATRRQIQKQALELQNQAEKAVEIAREQVDEAGHQVKKQADAARSRVQDVRDDGLQRVEDLKVQAGTTVSEGKKRLSQKTKELTQAVEA